jgi:hypothetical protein
MVMSNPQFLRGESSELARQNDGNDIWPALVNVYQEQGYEAGYARGVNDVLAAVLEATEDFIRIRGESDPEARRLLYAFSEFLENRVRTDAPNENYRIFVDGLGI